jgi:hypothetical protein
MTASRDIEERWRALVTFYREASTQLSTIIRQLTLAGFAFAWLFKSDVNGAWSIPKGIGWAIGLLVGSLFLDICQYLVTSFSADRALSQDKSPDLPLWHLKLMHGLWWGKVGFTLVGFGFLFYSAFNQFQFK